MTAKAGQDVRVVYDWMGAFDESVRAARRPHAPRGTTLPIRSCGLHRSRADRLSHLSGLVGLPRLVLLYLDMGLAYGKVLSVAQD
jgi:hypothetical protein